MIGLGEQNATLQKWRRGDLSYPDIVLRALPWLFVLLLFACSLLLNYANLTPRFYQINPQDEAFYINNGRLLAGGVWPPLAWNPLGAMLYGLLYLPLQHAPSWMVLANWWARLLLFCLLWLTSYLIARQFRSLASPLIFLTLFALGPIVPTLLTNTSDAMFACMSGLAFWQVLHSAASRRTGHLWLASCFVALSELTRNDGLVLLGILILVTLVLWRFPAGSDKRTVALRPVMASLAGCVVPFLAIVGAYIMLHGITSGSFGTDIKDRSYSAFEQGQGFAHGYSEATWTQGTLEARRLYGTPEENHFSVLQAIRRNPGAFAGRVLHVIPLAVFEFVFYYGFVQALALVALAAIGIRRLVREQHGVIVAMSLLWASHIGVYLAFFFRPGYLLFPYFVLLAIAAVGLDTVGQRLFQRGRAWYVPAGLAGVALLVAVQHSLRLTPFAIALAVTVAIVWLACFGSGDRRVLTFVSGMCAVLLAGIYHPGPHTLALGTTGEERAARYMEEHLAPGTLVGAWNPAVIWLAKQEDQSMDLDMSHVTSEASLDTWLRRTGVQAIYVDPWLQQLAPTAYALIERDIGTRFTVVFTVTDADPERIGNPADDLPVHLPDRFTVLAVKAGA